MPKPLFFLVFWVCTAVFLFFWPGDKIFPRRLSLKLRSQHQLDIKTPPSPNPPEIKIRLQGVVKRGWKIVCLFSVKPHSPFVDLSLISGHVFTSLKTVTSLNKRPDSLNSISIIVLGDNELKCSKCYDRKAKIVFRTSRCCNR